MVVAQFLRHLIAAVPCTIHTVLTDNGIQFTNQARALGWARLDLAAKLVCAHRAEWDGGQYYQLPPVAEALEQDHPLAAVILYRALLDDILARARSRAYPHAARYLAKLDALAASTDVAADKPAEIVCHADYRADLQKAHGRKSGFWALVGQE